MQDIILLDTKVGVEEHELGLKWFMFFVCASNFPLRTDLQEEICSCLITGIIICASDTFVLSQCS